MRGSSRLNRPLDVVELDRALEAFTTVDARRSQVVELRFFGGLTVEETAEVLHVSAETVKRDWRLAKLWLLRELKGDARRTSARPPDVTSNPWSRVAPIVDAALRHDDQTRAAFVAEACGNDVDLVREVESLLAHASGAADFLSTPALAMARSVLEREATQDVADDRRAWRDTE